MKKKLSLLLALLMLVSAFTACAESENTDQTEEQTPAADTVAPEEIEVVEEDGPIEPDIPELDFGGTDFTILTSGPNDTNGVDWVTYDVYVEELNGEVINDSVFERNLYLEETYNIHFHEHQCETTTLDEEKKDVQSGAGAYNAVFAQLQANATMAQSGFIYNLYDIPYIDLSKPWWDQRMVEDLTLMGDLYFCTGDITVIDNDATWVLMFNKQMREDLGLDDLYTLVREDRWTYDAFYGMVQAGTLDLDGNGKLTPTKDNFGFLTTGDSCQGLYYASGEKLTQRDDQGLPMRTVDTSRMSGVVEYAGKIMYDTDHVFVQDRTSYGTDNLRFLFEGGTGLFYGEVMQCIIRMRASETDFGLVPWPKYDEGQQNFYNFVHATAAKAINIPSTQTNLELCGAIIEAMAAKSMYTLTPAYYDVALTYKYMRDQESAEMLDIVLASRCYDMGYVYDWGGLYSAVRTLIYNGGEGFASKWGSTQKTFDKMLSKTLDKYADLKG